jgi:ubiquinone/menaquinone biosynthesis C-methylase UbiE
VSGQHELVARQFGDTAEAYARSSTHNDAAVLSDLVQIADPKPTDEALDIASGPGTLALAFAPHVAKMVVLDLTPSMLRQAEKRAVEQGLKNLTTVEAPAEALPFPDHSFDLVMVRTAPHHFSDVQLAIREMARVVRPGGKVLIVDTTSPEEPGLASELNHIEKLRDPSHVRNYTPSEWHETIRAAGLTILYERVHSHALGKRLLFKEWVERMRVPADTVDHLRGLFGGAGDGLRDLMQIEADGEDFSFTLPEITILATRTGTN